MHVQSAWAGHGLVLVVTTAMTFPAPCKRAQISYLGWALERACTVVRCSSSLECWAFRCRRLAMVWQVLMVLHAAKVRCLRTYIWCYMCRAALYLVPSPCVTKMVMRDGRAFDLVRGPCFGEAAA
jgi:hypothetical protein